MKNKENKQKANKIPKNVIIYALVVILMLSVVSLAITKEGIVEVNGALKSFSGSSSADTNAPVTAAPTTTAPAPAPSTTTPAAPDANAATTTAAPSANSTAPQTNEEIIKKYTELVDKFKKEKPAYKRLEYQTMPEEYRNFGSIANTILDIASGYMTTEDQAEQISRPAGAPEILNDMPIHGTEKGCVLTNYDAVAWAKDEDLGDGTRKISFSLKEEMDAAPTPADTCVPVSNHGAVMQPLKMDDIMKEVDNVTSKIPGAAVNHFNLKYSDCVFSCVYDPATNQVKSITHNIIIDITASVKVFVTVEGSVRITNDMFISDITW